MDGREETTGGPGVYCVIQRNVNETAGKQLSYIIVLTLRATGHRSFEKESNVGF